MNSSIFAPGSIMLFGEHAVLHGYPAICVPIKQGIQIDLEFMDINGLAKRRVLVKSIFAGELEISWEDLLSLNIGLQQYYKFRFVLAAMQEFCAVLIKQAYNLNNLDFNLVININSSIPEHWGLGSSAAVVAAILKALNLVFNNIIENPYELWLLGLKAIHKIQGIGSGADLAASLYANIIYIEQNKITQLTNAKDIFKQYPWYLIYSGFKTPTAEVVAIVNEQAQNFPDLYANIYVAMGEVTRQAAFALEAQKIKQIAKLMQAQHGLLYSLGVSNQNIDNIVADLQYTAYTLGAKISGSGMGDCILALGGDEATIISKYQEQVWRLEI